MPLNPPFDPVEFLSLSQSLAGAGADEARLRTAVNRAYYALFLIARDKLGVTTTEKVHGEVIRVLTRRKRKTADAFFSLFNLRRLADYEMQPSSEREQDWNSNWLRAQALVRMIAPELEKML